MAIDFLVDEAADGVGVVVVEGVKAGQEITDWVMKEDQTIKTTVLNDIPIGHKLALKDFAAGDTVINYNVVDDHKTSDLSDSQSTKGNIEGGLTTIEEKALGNIQKIGTKAPVVGCLDMTIRTANGRLTAAEALGHREFIFTRLYESA